MPSTQTPSCDTSDVHPHPAPQPVVDDVRFATSVPPEQAGAVAAWLDRCQDELLHPAEVADRLRRTGWPPFVAAGVADQYRRRFNEHPLGYSALLVATGLVALSAGTAGHLLTAGLNGPVDRNALGRWLTVAVCSLPFAVWAHHWAAKADRDDPVAVWSVPRRRLAEVLLWACAIVGVGRLLVYMGQLIGTLVGASWAEGTSIAAGAVNVAITLSIALPLGLWAYWFRHRFDSEDPTVRARPRRPVRP